MTSRLFSFFTALVVAPMVPGLIAKTKAAFAGRRGPPLLQLYYDLFKLVRKGAVYSRTTTVFFRAGPVVSLAAVLAAALFAPLAGTASVLSFNGDIILFAYLFGLARFFTVTAALDTGSSFEGMGAAREAAFSLFAELALFVNLVGLANATGSFSLAILSGRAMESLVFPFPGSLILTALSLFVVALVENCRVPVDDPATHLELTMIHEVMALDHSGPDLAFILYGAALKLTLTLSILAHIILPMGPGDPLKETALFFSALAALSMLVGVVESSMARLRLVRVPRLLMAACVLAVFAVALRW